MIPINIDPNMFSIGPMLITWHGFFSAVGLGVGLWLTANMVAAASKTVTADDVYSIALWAVPGGIVGARLLYVLENAYLFANNPLGMFAINEGGISIYGAVIGGTLAGAIYCSRSHKPLAMLADRAMIGLLLGQGIGRIGDIINGEHHGREAFDFPFSVVYTHPNTLGERGLPVHLAVGYELVYDLVFAWLLTVSQAAQLMTDAILGFTQLLDMVDESQLPEAQRRRQAQHARGANCRRLFAKKSAHINYPRLDAAGCRLKFQCALYFLLAHCV